MALKTILIVEDEIGIASFLKQGYIVGSAKLQYKLRIFPKFAGKNACQEKIYDI